MHKRQYILAAITAIVLATVPLAIGLLNGSNTFSQANRHDGQGPEEQLTSGNPTEVGQSAFAAIQEIVAILEADPNTDWSKVNLSALREHLIDMNEVTLNAAVQERQGNAHYRDRSHGSSDRTTCPQSSSGTRSIK